MGIAVLATLCRAETLDGRGAVIIDGDTLVFGLERIRIENIDAPETRKASCERELIAGLRAKEMLAGLVRSGPVAIKRDGQDPYGRTLAGSYPWFSG
jgi:micrococcal nuclease